MKDLKLKNDVLDEIISLMEEKSGEKLSNHPRLIAAKMTVAKPVDDPKKALKEKLMGDSEELEPGHEESESPEMEKSESEETIDPEMLMELMKQLKGK